MKKILSYIFIAATLVGSFSCDEQLDINQDPLAATSADPNSVIPFVLAAYEARKQTELGTRIMDVSQHFSACFNSPRAGVTTSFLTGNIWGMYYPTFLGNLQLLEQDAKAAGENQNNVAAIAVILKALAFYELSVIFEDIPYTQALNGQEFPNPAFDTQETVLKGTVDLLDEAVALIDALGPNPVTIGSSDFIYNGNIESWRRFANSLQLRILMIIRNVDAGYADSRIVSVLGRPLIEENSQTARFPFFDQPGNVNSFADLNNTFFGTEDNEVAGVYAPSQVLTDILLNNNDPRLDVFITTRSANNVYAAPPMGSFAFGTFPTVISNNMIRNDFPAVWYTPAENDLYRAELALAGVISGDANAFLRSGVVKAITYWGRDIDGALTSISDADAQAYANTLTASNNVIAEQQYLETFMRPVVAWNTVRRNRFPVLDPIPGASIGDFLQRFSIPPDEQAANTNAPANKADNAVPQWAFPNN